MHTAEPLISLDTSNALYKSNSYKCQLLKLRCVPGPYKYK